MFNNTCTPAERVIMEEALIAAKKQLQIALKAKEGSAIFESAASIRGRISYLEEFLATHPC